MTIEDGLIRFRQWELLVDPKEECVSVNRTETSEFRPYLLSTPVDNLNDLGWSDDNLDKKSELFIPGRVRAQAERLYAEFFPNQKLLPCPFCGENKAKQDSSSGAREVECGKCGAYTWGPTPLQAVKRWNRRVER